MYTDVYRYDINSKCVLAPHSLHRSLSSFDTVSGQCPILSFLRVGSTSFLQYAVLFTGASTLGRISVTLLLFIRLNDTDIWNCRKDKFTAFSSWTFFHGFK